MNLYKINKSLTNFVSNENFDVPDVYECFCCLGESMMGRKIILFSDVKDKDKMFFNKSQIHKEHASYIGSAREGYYAQEIMNIGEEERFLCVRGTANKRQDIADKIMAAFPKDISNFVFDLAYMDKGTFLIELNELNLSSINKKELEFVLSRIL